MRIILKRLIIIALVLMVPYIYILVITTTRTDRQALMPGDINNVNDLIEINTQNNEEGSFNSVYVTTFSHTTIFQNMLLETSEISTSNDISYQSYYSNKELSDQGILYKDTSIMYSLIYSYKEASKRDSNINLMYEYTGFKIAYYAEGLAFKVNDLIYQINNYNVNDNVDDFKNAFLNQNVGDTFYILRDNKVITHVLTSDDVYKSNDHTYVRYGYYHIYDIDYENSTPSIKINKSSTVGPSAGLLQTLSVFNRLLSFDYTHGLTISGTGTIDVAGNVGAIGGIEQKVYTASLRKVDVFFCPRENATDGLKAYNSLRNKGKMKFYVVDTFEDAVKYLEELDA